MKPRNHSAADIYREFRRDVAVLIEWLNEELAAPGARAAQEPARWDFAGDVGHVRQQLRQIIMELAGLDADAIEQVIRRRRKRPGGK
jgi:hypothetical protein